MFYSFLSIAPFDTKVNVFRGRFNIEMQRSSPLHKSYTQVSHGLLHISLLMINYLHIPILS